MKAPIVALAATAAGFAAASAYLYGELSVERVSTQAEVAARSRHEAHSNLAPHTIEFVAADGQAEASVLPFSANASLVKVDSEGATPLLVSQQLLAVSTNEAKELEERSAAPRLARRLSRERAALPDPANH